MSKGRGFITAVDLLLYNQRGEGNLPLARLAVERENGPAHSGEQLVAHNAEPKGSLVLCPTLTFRVARYAVNLNYSENSE